MHGIPFCEEIPSPVKLEPSLVQLEVMKICCNPASTLLMLQVLLYPYLHVGGSSRCLLRPPASYQLWDSAGHLASSHPTVGGGTLGGHCFFLPGCCLLRNPTPCLRVLVRHLTPLGHLKLFWVFCVCCKMLMKPRSLNSHDVVNYILESEIWVKVESYHINGSGNRFWLQLQYELIYVW